MKSEWSNEKMIPFYLTLTLQLEDNENFSEVYLPDENTRKFREKKYCT